MSFAATAWALDLKITPPTKKFVLLVLASYTSTDETCFPSQKKIAEQVGITDRRVRGWLMELEEDGWIRREERRRSDGSRCSDMIALNVPQADASVLPPRKPTSRLARTPASGLLTSNEPPMKERERPPRSSNSICEKEWTPSVATVKELKAEGSTQKIIDKARPLMIDWSIGKGEARRDWDAVFRSWVRRDRDKPEKKTEKKVSLMSGGLPYFKPEKPMANPPTAKQREAGYKKVMKMTAGKRRKKA